MRPEAENSTGTALSAVLVQSTNAFYRDLPALLKSGEGMWVA
jgi:hypothetical protein